MNDQNLITQAELDTILKSWMGDDDFRHRVELPGLSYQNRCALVCTIPPDAMLSTEASSILRSITVATVAKDAATLDREMAQAIIRKLDLDDGEPMPDTVQGVLDHCNRNQLFGPKVHMAMRDGEVVFTPRSPAPS